MTDKHVADLRQQVEAALDGIAGMVPAKRDAVLEDAKEMIHYYLGLSDQIEERRTRHFEFGLVYAAVLVAGLGLVLPNTQEFGALGSWALVGTLVSQLLFTVYGLLVFTMQSVFPYPFLKLPGLGNQWKWFYYGNSSILKISTSPLVASTDAAKTTLPYLEGLLTMTSNYAAETPQSAVRSALIQLYLLQVHNYYKNRWYTQLFRVSAASITFGVGYLGTLSLIWLVPLAVRLAGGGS